MILKDERLKKRILIVDSDDRQIRRIVNIIMKSIREMNQKVEIRAAHTISEADTLLKEGDIDILILDTIYRGCKRGEFSGIDWVRRLRVTKKYQFLPVIFIASIEKPKEYAYKELNCLGFLPRVFETAHFYKVLEKALEYATYRDEENYILLRKQGVIYPIQIKEIVYVEWEHPYFHVHQENGEILSFPYKRISEFYEEANADCLIRCNRSILVNKLHILDVDFQKQHIILKNKEEKLTIGRVYMDMVKKELIPKSGLVHIRSNYEK